MGCPSQWLALPNNIWVHSGVSTPLFTYNYGSQSCPVCSPSFLLLFSTESESNRRGFPLFYINSRLGGVCGDCNSIVHDSTEIPVSVFLYKDSVTKITSADLRLCALVKLCFDVFHSPSLVSDCVIPLLTAWMWVVTIASQSGSIEIYFSVISEQAEPNND